MWFRDISSHLWRITASVLIALFLSARSVFEIQFSGINRPEKCHTHTSPLYFVIDEFNKLTLAPILVVNAITMMCSLESKQAIDIN